MNERHNPQSPPPRATLFRRFAPLILLALIVPLPVLGLFAWHAMTTMSNNTAEWLPGHFRETQEYFWFVRRFDTDEILVASWPGCTIDDERLDAVVRDAAAVLDPAWTEPVPLFSRIVSGRSVLAEMMAEPLDFSREEAVSRLQGWLVGPDARSTCAVFSINRASIGRRGLAVETVRRAAGRQGIAAADIHLGGPTADSVAVDSESQRSLQLLSGCSIVVGLALSYWCLRSLWLVAIANLTAGLSELAAMAVVDLCGDTMDMVLIMMPALVYILVITGCIHQLNYYVEEARKRGPDGAESRALAHSWLPSLLAAVTTALGLASLAIGDIVPTKKFGMYSAAGILLGLVFLFLVPSSLLAMFPPRRLIAATARRRGRSLTGRWSLRMAAFGWRHHRCLLGAGGIAAAALAVGVSRVHTSAKIQHLFASDARVLTDYRWLEQHIGPIVPVEVVLRFAATDPRREVQRLAIVEEVRARLASVKGLGSTVSLAKFLPALPDRHSTRDIIRTRVIDQRLANDRARLRETMLLVDDAAAQEQLWRISGRAYAFTDQDYSAILEEMGAAAAPVVERHRLAGAPPIKIVMCGGVPLITLVQREMLTDLRDSFAVAVLTIALAMAVMLRIPGTSLVMMIPNILPATLVFGLLGWSGVLVDLGSMLTISTALGISVDNELHFFAWFRRSLAAGHSRRRATLYAYRQCGNAMTETALICALGMFPFALSPFVPVARFGWLMFAMITAAMLADVLVMPALMASPLGRLFGRTPPTRPRPQASAETVLSGMAANAPI